MDSAFFSQNILSTFNSKHVKFTASVPFERLTQLKEMIEKPKTLAQNRPAMVLF